MNGVQTHVVVKARNHCSFWIAASESWFEIRATPNGGSGAETVEVKRFPVAIGPNSSDAEAIIEIYCSTASTIGCAYKVTTWWAAGGGKKAE